MKLDKQQLLFITPGFPKNEGDSQCIPALQLFVKELVGRGLFEVTIISLHYPYSAKNYRWNGVEVHALGGNNKSGFAKLLNLRKAFRLALKLNQKRKYDFIHSFWLGECTWIGNRLSKRLRIQHSCTLMGQDVLPENNFLTKLKPPHQLIALSSFHSTELKKHSKLKANCIIPWGVDENSKSFNQPKTIDLISVGWLNKVKAHHLFIELVAKLVKTYPQLKAEIVGEGELKGELENKIKNLGLQQNVKLTGGLNRLECMRKMSQSKIMIVSSSFESFGMVTIEAIAQGADVFSKAVGIALELDEVSIYESPSELLKKVHTALETNHTVKPEKPLTIQYTVDQYLELIFR